MVLSRRSRGRLGGLRRPRSELRGQDAEAPEGGTLAPAARALRGVPVHHRSQQMWSEAHATQTKMSQEILRTLAF